MKTKLFSNRCAGILTLLLALTLSTIDPRTATAAPTATVGGLAGTGTTTTISADTLNFVPKTNDSVDFTLNVAGDNFSAGSVVFLDWSASTAFTVSSPDTVSKDTGTDTAVSFDNQLLSVLQGSSFISLFNSSSKTSIMLTATLSNDSTVTPAKATGTFDVNFFPAETVFDLPGNYVLPASTTGNITVNATLKGTLSTDITWSATKNGAFTVTSPNVSSDVPYGTDGTKGGTFNLSGDITAGDTLTVKATLGKYADGRGNVASKDRTVVITFLNEGDIRISESEVEAYLNCPLNHVLRLSGTVPNSSDVLTITSITPVGDWNGITITPSTTSGNTATISLTGTPASADREMFFKVNANYNGANKESAFHVYVFNPTLKADPTSITDKMGTLVSRTASITSVPDTAAATGLLVQPQSFNGLTVSLNSTTTPATLSVYGTPTTTGTGTFSLIGSTNGIAVGENFTVTITSADSVIPIPTSLVPDKAGSWEGEVDEDGSFRIATTFKLPDGVSRTDCEDILAAFLNGSFVDWELNPDGDGNYILVLMGTIDSSKTAADVRLEWIKLVLSNGTVYEQSNIALTLQQILDANHRGGGSGGCNAAAGMGTLALAVLFAVLKRR